MLCHSVQGESASHFCERNSNPRTHISFLSSIFSRRFHLCFFFFFFFFSLYFLRSTWSALKRSGPRSNLRFFSAPCGCLGNENVCVVHIQQPEKRRPRAHPPSIPLSLFPLPLRKESGMRLGNATIFFPLLFFLFCPRKYSSHGGVYIIEKKRERRASLSLSSSQKYNIYFFIFLNKEQALLDALWLATREGKDEVHTHKRKSCTERE